MSTVNIAYVEFGDGYRSSSLSETLRIVRTAGMRVGHLVIVDNKGVCTPLSGVSADRVTVLAGDNRLREFGAWDDALGVIDPALECAAWLFVNDTFVAHRRSRRIRNLRISTWLRHVAKSPEPMMFGQIDPLNIPSHATPFENNGSFLCSYLFGMNPGAKKSLFPLTQSDEVFNQLLNSDYTDGGLFNRSMNSAYQAYLEHWLFTDGQWRNAQPLSPANFQFLRLKAKSILYEHSLIPKALRQKVRVFDIFDGQGFLDIQLGRFARTWLRVTAVKGFRDRVMRRLGQAALFARSTRAKPD